MIFKQYNAYYTTATILEWKYLLKHDKYKDIILDSLKYLVEKRRIILNAFVIMNNHMHLIWQIVEPNELSAVQRDFLRFVAQNIKYDLKKHHPNELKRYKVDAADREYQIWERNPLSVEIWSEWVMRQKLNYIHQNPVRANLVSDPEKYKYSSAYFYKTGIDTFGMLTHIDF